MHTEIQAALAHDRVIDITTIGRKSGQSRRIEIWFHNLDGRIYITGLPGRRDWYANLQANPSLTFHLKERTTADLPARARLIEEEEERRQILAGILTNLGQRQDLETWVAHSPLIEVLFASGEV